ncbi:prolyl 4-hydroxylase subunit alpha-1-like [Watersipora subatra]|uniref:prolyl 4-hydroxylase subunit alpha-1-like n=1 Tax=Watersipora subatra TaxID=2589382 RepID=UPI00355B536D
MKITLTCLWMLSALTFSHAEIFTAMATMKKALDIEQQFAVELKSYVPLIKDKVRSEKVARLAEEYGRVANLSLLQPEAYLANPVNAYMLCKRFTADLKEVRELLDSPHLQQEFDTLIATHRAEAPDREDFDGVIEALLRLQDTYEIPCIRFVDGTFTSDVNSPRMTASDCFEIGKHAYDRKDSYHSLLWLLESVASLEMEGTYQSMDRVLLLDYLIYALIDQGNNYHAMHYAQQLLDLKPANPVTVDRIASVIDWLHAEIAKENATRLAEGRPIPQLDILPPVSNKRELSAKHMGKEYVKYEALCRGEDIMANPYKHDLKCYYSTSDGNPLLLLAPVKVEELYKSPDILLYHDVISDGEIEMVKNLSTPILKRATVNDPNTGRLIYSSYRVSRSSWLYDRYHEAIVTITKRISAITNLDMTSAEGLQVVNYGIGGQYEPHYDHSRDGVDGFPVTQGNRVATWIYYMSDVSAGGYTVFTKVGVKVPPIKGAAAFWWNLKRNGNGDSMTKHAGCPVLSGSKWVANKWTHIIGQEWRRPCTLNEHE